jgi:hypothetical protein
MIYIAEQETAAKVEGEKESFRKWFRFKRPMDSYF